MGYIEGGMTASQFPALVIILHRLNYFDHHLEQQGHIRDLKPPLFAISELNMNILHEKWLEVCVTSHRGIY